MQKRLNRLRCGGKLIGLGLVQRRNQRFRLFFADLIPMMVPIEVPAKSHQDHGQNHTDHHTITAPEVAEVVLADGIVHFAKQRFLFGGLTAGQSFFAGGGVCRQGHEF